MDVPQGEPVADLQRINLEKLISGDAKSVQDLVRAAETTGFFYLDLQGLETKALIDEADHLLGLSSKYFAQPQALKDRQSRPSTERGYKSAIGHESFEIARDELDDAELAFPGFWYPERALLARFANHCDCICKALLDILSKAIDLQGMPTISNIHRRLESLSGLKFISSPTSSCRRDAPDTTHTDSGILTLLWATQLSSQILDPSTNQWSWVHPPNGCVLVNVADWLERQSGRRLKSCTHRVTQVKDFYESRHFLSYYLRPPVVVAVSLED